MLADGFIPSEHLIGQNLLRDCPQVLLGQPPVEPGVPQVMRRALTQADQEHATCALKKALSSGNPSNADKDIFTAGCARP
jgi:hypothetical protein